MKRTYPRDYIFHFLYSEFSPETTSQEELTLMTCTGMSYVSIQFLAAIVDWGHVQCNDTS